MEKYFEILEKMKKEGIDETKLFILSCINIRGKNEKKWEIMDYCYDVWLSSNLDISLSRLVDIVVKKWKDIQNDKISNMDILEECVEY